MLRWRLILGSLLIALLAALCWFDVQAQRPGIYFAPLAVALCLLATHEMLGLLRASGHTPIRWAIYLGTLAPVLASCAPIAWEEYPEDCAIGRLGWLACGLAAGLIVAVVGEMLRYQEPGATIANLASAALSILYVGGLLGFMVQLRLLTVGGDVARGGMLAMLSAIIIAKSTDTGGYVAGHTWGSHKMAPLISPGKTWEGTAGGLVLAVLAALVALGPLASLLGCASQTSWLRWFASAVAYGLAVGGAGIIGDLAESLLKRDAGVKDSSTWIPGLGGVLDVLDSLLFAAPVAYLCWAVGLVGP